MSIFVCPLSRVAERVAALRPHRVVSILDPDGPPFPELGDAYDGRHLRLSFHDRHEAEPGITLASDDQIGELLQFLERSAGEPVLIHCFAGLSRSTAVAFIAACLRHPEVPELAIAEELRRTAPLARPNFVVVALADERMGRRGRMLDALAAVFADLPWPDVYENVPFELVVGAP